MAKNESIELRMLKLKAKLILANKCQAKLKMTIREIIQKNNDTIEWLDRVMDKSSID